MNKIVGAALLAVGVLLLVMGINASESFSSEVSEAVRGTPTDRSIWLLVGGGVMGVVGLGLLLLGRPK
ncbi:MAG TPA: DUF3185 family protein [Planctomycetota bacterium]